MAGFKAGQLVQVSDPRNLSYGRIAMLLSTKEGGRSQVRFADLPQGIGASDDPTGLVHVFDDDDELTAISHTPIADFYLLVTIDEQNGDQSYQHCCLAHGQIGKTGEEIAQGWYPEGGEWDEDESAFVFCSERVLSAAAQDWEKISVGEYVQLSRALSDCTPGYVSGPTYGEDTEAEYIRRQAGD
mgnify:CR=1 FL=1